MKYTFAFVKRFLSKGDADAINELIAQLSSSARPIKNFELNQAAAKSRFLIVRHGQSIIGMGVLAPFWLSTGIKGRVEDIVVHKDFRHQGIGGEIIKRLIAEAKKLGMASLHLTSHPQRREANKLYLKMGFERRKTNVYVMQIE